MRFWFVKGDNSVVSARPYEVKAPRFNLRGLVVRDSFAGVKFISLRGHGWVSYGPGLRDGKTGSNVVPHPPEGCEWM